MTSWILAAITLALAAALAVRLGGRGDPREQETIERLGTGGLAMLPGALLVYLSFNAGGFFVGTTAPVAVALLVILATRVVVSEGPFAGLSRALALAAGALVLYALWTLLSATWSHAPARALIEFDRVLLYVAAIALFGSVPRDPSRIRWMVRSLALGMLVVCTAALVSRLLPELWPTAPNIVNNRLSYPITYWNALGIVVALGLVFSLHIASSRSEPRVASVLAAAASPLFGTALYFTFSRGAIIAAAIGLLAYVVLARSRGLLGGLLATAPATAIALVVAYRADRLASVDATGPAAVAQGHGVALALALGAGVAALVRLALFPADARVARVRLPVEARRPVLASAAVLSVATAVAVTVAADIPGFVGVQLDRFVNSPTVGGGPDLRARLTDPSSSVRIATWRLASRGFANARFKGHGAGTYELKWARERPPDVTQPVIDAHSLYLESLHELGVIGLGLLAVAIVTILAGFAIRLRGQNGTVYAGLLAAALAWAVHAGVDWDWEMPATGLWLFAVGGAALAARARSRHRGAPLRLVIRAVTAVAILALTVVPVLLATSQADIERGTQALELGDCGTAIREANAARSALDLRPEPYEIIGYCQAAQGAPGPAVSAMRAAVERDPDNWEAHYGLALAQAAGGVNPRPAAATALRLNPLAWLPDEATALFAVSSPGAWKMRAERAHLFVSPRGLLPSFGRLRGEPARAASESAASATPAGR